jgi:nicotinamide mononucleotide transporter PnuC
MKKIKNPFKELTKFEIALWICSLIVVTISFLIPEKKDYLNLITSLIGVTALIFVAKGMVIGQLLCVIFAVLYGIASFMVKYYGEMITYVGMSAPMAIASVVSWIKNPYKGSSAVKVNRLNKKAISTVFALSVVVTIVFYFILRCFNTENLIFSTISVTTSFIAASFTFLRSPYYALAYASNDIILIILWILMSVKDIDNLPMIFCFIMFLFNDLYGFINWCKMEKIQKA